MNNKFMKLAIDEALIALDKKEGGPFGAVIVKNGKIISIGRSSVFKTKDSTTHAVLCAIRNASKKLKTSDLSGCEIFTNGEPCPMCFGSIYWAKIKTLYYGADIRDSIKSGVPEIKMGCKKINKKGKWKVNIIDNYMKEDCLKPFIKFRSQNTNY